MALSRITVFSIINFLGVARHIVVKCERKVCKALFSYSTVINGRPIKYDAKAERPVSN